MPAIASCRLRGLRAPSTAALRDRVCSPMYWYRSMPIINRSTGSRRSMLAKASTWIARPLPDGWAQPANCWLRWLKLFAIMSCPQANCTPTTRRSRCSRRATAGRRSDDSGPMSATTGHRAIRPHPPYGSPTRPIARARTHANTYAGFQHLYEGGTIVEVACWAHARRKFHEIHIAHPSPTTTEAIERIAALYAIEKEIRGSTPEIRKTVRQARAKALLDSMHTWLEAALARLSRKSDTAAAIRYGLSRWRALTRYVDDEQLEIDNNAAERALRVVALGRKNFLFAGSNAGGERAAAIYSLLGSAKLNGLDPEIYLQHALECIADHPISRINELLPWNLALPSQS